MKHSYETYIEYRKRVLDPISESFCAAKWYNATVWLGHGATSSCHHPPAHRVPLDEIKSNPKALHNTIHKKVMRAMMLNGQRPPECEYCWKIEDMKKDDVSDRVYKTVIYSDEEIQKAGRLQPKDDVNPITLEIAFERTCNFACSYCNASFSSRWAQDIKRSGPYQNLVSDGGGAFQQDGSWAEPYSPDQTNPYVEAFWTWWPELSKSLRELRITGGEPLMSQHVWRLFDYFKENMPYEMVFAVNSNLGIKDELVDKLIENSQYVPQFDLYTSNESYGAHAEYIRDGLEFERWSKNVLKICENANIREFHMMMTINALCLYSLPEFLDFLLDIKSKFGRNFPIWTANILRFPSFMSPTVLPDELKEERKQALQKWLDKNGTHRMLHELEVESLKRLVNYLDIVKTPHRYTSQDKEKRESDFKSFYSQYDQRRNKNLVNTFPSLLTDWYNSIKVIESNKKQTLINGDATDYFHDPRAIERYAKKIGLK